MGRFFSLFIPSSLSEASTYQQQIRYLDDQIEKLKERVAALEEEGE